MLQELSNRGASARPVIGFDKQRGSFGEWLSDPQAGPRIFSVSGMGGIGKTTLLLELAQLAKAASVLTLWLDGQSECATSGDFLLSLEMMLESEYGRKRSPDQPLLTYIAGELSRQRTVLLVDNCEGIGRLEGWLFSRFLPRLDGACILVVFASRTGLSAKWRANPYWGPRLEPIPLRLFTREEVLQYLSGSGLEPDMRMDIAQKTDGYPLLLALTTDLIIRSREEQGARNQAGSLREIPALLSVDLLKEAASPDLYPALTALSLVPAADQRLLELLLEHPVNDFNYYALSELSFVRATSQGLSMHHVASRLLREDYAQRSPQLFQAARGRALELLAERFHEVDKRQQMRIAAHVLEVYREFLPAVHAYAHFSSTLRLSEPEPFQPEDLPTMHRFMAASVSAADWQSELVKPEDYHLLLEDISRCCPDGICVVRDATGEPLGFVAGLWLHDRTLRLFERYAPGWEAVLGEEADKFRGLPPEGADTLFVLLAAVDVTQTIYQPEELGALLMQQWLVYMTSGLRGMLVTADPQLNTLLPLLGFQRRASAPSLNDNILFGADGARDGSAPWTKWELDFRQTSFDAWIQQVIRKTGGNKVGDNNNAGEGTAPEPALTSLNPTVASPAVHLDEQEMKQVLRHLFDDAALEKLSAVRALAQRGVNIGELIERILMERPPEHPLTEMEQQLLRESYVQRRRNKNQLAEAYHMSRPTFYRHSRTAIRHLIAAVKRLTDS
ncbi:hypothetical protein [Paenibacillus sanguinis]|uniref:hypothetical protein n=1 Tax=Paenibacillus sanguinis TaxID=225906 RepID=UPI000364FF36|nr:hypothetical protein [Paenibacillus sanguinis]